MHGAHSLVCVCALSLIVPWFLVVAALDLDDDGDDDLSSLLQPRSPTSRSAGAAVGLDEVLAEDRSHARRSGKARAGGKGKEGLGAHALTGITADLRAGGQLPEGMSLVGGDPQYEEQDDGSQALIMPDASYLKLTLPHVSPWALEDDGRLHRFSLMVAMRCAHRARAPLWIRQRTLSPTRLR